MPARTVCRPTPVCPPARRTGPPDCASCATRALFVDVCGDVESISRPTPVRPRRNTGARIRTDIFSGSGLGWHQGVLIQAAPLGMIFVDHLRFARTSVEANAAPIAPSERSLYRAWVVRRARNSTLGSYELLGPPSALFRGAARLFGLPAQSRRATRGDAPFVPRVCDPPRPALWLFQPLGRRVELRQ